MYEYEIRTLQSLYEEGVFKSSFYKKKLYSKEVFLSYDQFLEISFTYKEELRKISAFERTTTPMQDVFGIFSSTGTTGEKTFYVYSKKDKLVHKEFVQELLGAIGLTANDLGGVMAPLDTGVMAHAMMWQFSAIGAGFVNCPIPSPENMIELVKKVPVTVISTRPDIVTSVVYQPEFAKAAKESSVKKLVLGGDFLTEERRTLLEQTWDAECYNMFGMSEMFGPMAGECKKKNGLHYINKYLMIEILDPKTKQPVREGQIGVAVYTTLWDKGFPLLRYWTDDLMRLETAPCGCGSKNPRLFYIGRLSDHIRVNGASVFPSDVESILFAEGLIGEYKVVQNGEDITVFTEALAESVQASVCEKLCALFKRQVGLSVVTPRSLGYLGTKNRFEIKLS